MQKIKSVVVGLFIMGIFLCIFTFFLPRHVTLERGAEIQVSRDSLQAFLEDLQNLPRWCTWLGKDSVVTRKYSPASAGKEATIVWYPNGQPENRNFIAIMQTVPGSVRVHYQFRNLLPASGGFTLTGKGKDRTFLEWTMEVKLRWYPWEKLSGIAMDKVWGASMSESLNHLRALYGDTTTVDDSEANP